MALIILAELELRALGAYATWEERNGGEYVSPYAVQGNSWLMLRPPNTHMEYAQPEFNFPLKTNSMGIRDKDHAAAKPSGTKRIIVLGDSFTEGQGAIFKESWPKVLEQSLNTDGEASVEVIMGGVAGSDPFYCRRLLEERLMQFNPDLVILALNSFDVTDVMARGGEERFLADDRVQYKKTSAWEPLFAKSRLGRLLAMRVFACDWLLLSPREHMKANEEARKNIAELVKEMELSGGKNGFQLVVVLQPHLQELKTGRYNQGLNSLGQQITGEKIPVCDVLPCMKKHLDAAGTPPESLYWEKDFHPNAKGYALFADCIRDWLFFQSLP
ncbi:SGNH/GDSL hydrolase family protein [Desulfatibacillum aliphaticivorans]|uniref:SGNH/GDSL hydrolase family protein n=1 Tax=Desulfatibacillum aliphaticivorans TaxID=218208 RepID=UPI001470A66B|nr:GDSL-type esterase/lipase family protein [Desulfatibacillum aliphaticivorans]